MKPFSVASALGVGIHASLPCVDGVHGDNEIVSMWEQHYEAIFNSVENSSCDQAHSDFWNTNIVFDNGTTVDIFEMKAVIDDLASYMSPGLDGLSAEHFKFDTRLYRLLWFTAICHNQ